MLILLSILGDIERSVADLYPYRYVITPLVVAAGLAAAYVAYQKNVHLYLWRHRLATGIVGVPAIVLAVVAGNYFLSPLWERSFLDEASPLAANAAVEDTETPSGTSEPGAIASATPATGEAVGEETARVTHRGEVEGADSFHFARGDALIIETAEGDHILRFENFSVRNGPDLFVYLTEDESGESVVEELNLGELKATDGAFNYEIPQDVDLSRIKSAVVWCRQFGVLFAVAVLAPN